MDKREGKKKGALQPNPDILVSSRGVNGEENALAVAYCGNCSFDPPMVMVGIVPSRYSHHMIKESGCFVVNLVAKSYEETYKYLGSHSRKDVDKLKEKNVKTAEAKVVKAPLLVDCPVNIECTIVDSIMTGSHEMFVGKIEYVHADKDLLKEDGTIDFSKISFL